MDMLCGAEKTPGLTGDLRSGEGPCGGGLPILATRDGRILNNV